MSALDFLLPWDSQPQEVAQINADSWQARNLSLWYPLNGNTFDPVKNNLGTPNSGAKFVPSSRGMAAFFDGSDDYISWPSTTLGNANNFTFSAWVYYSGSLSARGTVYGCENAANTFQLEVGGGAGGATTGGVTAIYAGNLIGSTVNSVLTANTWTHVVYIKRGSGATSEFYINGVQASVSANVSNDYTETASVHTLGRRSAGSQLFSGMLQDVRINNFAMSVEQVADIYRSGLQLFAPRSIWVPVSAGGGGTTVTGALGTAAASGFTGNVNANRTIAASLGTATASGFQGTVSNSTDTTIAGNLGTATASGFTGGVNANRTIAGALGTAVASGFQGTVSNTNDTVVNGSLGTAVASGFAGAVIWNRVVSGSLGEAIASGLTGGVVNGDTQDNSGGWPIYHRKKKKKDDDEELEPAVIEAVAVVPAPRRMVTLEKLIGKKAAAQVNEAQLSSAIRMLKRKRQDEELMLM